MLQKLFLPELRNNASIYNSYFPERMIIFLGTVHKGRRHKIVKNWYPPPLSVRTHHKFWKIQSFLHQKVRTSASVFLLVRKMSALDKPPSTLTTDVFYGRPLSYDVIFTLIFVSVVQHSISFGPRAATDAITATNTASSSSYIHRAVSADSNF